MCTWFSASWRRFRYDRKCLFSCIYNPQITISPTSLFSANFNGNHVKNHPKPWTCPLNGKVCHDTTGLEAQAALIFVIDSDDKVTVAMVVVLATRAKDNKQREVMGELWHSVQRLLIYYALVQKIDVPTQSTETKHSKLCRLEIFLMMYILLSVYVFWIGGIPLPFSLWPSLVSCKCNIKTFLFPKLWTCRVFHSTLLSSSISILSLLPVLSCVN